MKKFALILLLGFVLATGAFAESNHPGGWGVGGGFQFGGAWRNSDIHSGLALFLKAPQLPIYWGINLNIFDWEFATDKSYFGLSVTGDYYYFDRPLYAPINLGWYAGGGAYFGFYSGSTKTPKHSHTTIDLGVRIPIGLSWQPLDFLEVFLDIAPSVGFYMTLNDPGKNKMGLGGGWQGDLGVRFWL